MRLSGGLGHGVSLQANPDLVYREGEGYFHKQEDHIEGDTGHFSRGLDQSQQEAATGSYRGADGALVTLGRGDGHRWAEGEPVSPTGLEEGN